MASLPLLLLSAWLHNGLITMAHALLEGDVRLVDGPNRYSGRLEVYYNDTWGTVCDGRPAGWIQDVSAEVVCRQLGLTGGTAIQEAPFGPGDDSQPIWMNDVTCNGTEARVRECWHAGPDVRSCSHEEDVGIVCAPAGQGDVRLVDGPDRYSGRLEVRLDGTWGTVCQDFFHDASAEVVCRQLGFNGGTAIQYSLFTPGSDSQPIWMGNVSCVGTEARVVDCPRRGNGLGCGHHEDVGIACSPAHGDVRLVDGPDLLSGRLEVFHNGVWGTVCDDWFRHAAAEVVCRQLGLSGGFAMKRAPFGAGADSQPIWMDDVECKGTEASVWECLHEGPDVQGCGHHEDAGVVCLAPPTPAPTSSPTTAPTSSPTSAPTSSPTTAPTSSPTSLSTGSPTSSPTGSPTSSPTASPTVSPTPAPTPAPTSCESPATHGYDSLSANSAWDGSSTIDCGFNKALVRIESTHNDRKGDRQWRYSCGLVMGGFTLIGCTWTQYSSFDAHWNEGQTGKIIAGIASFHSNWFEDRMFRFKLCSIVSPYGEVSLNPLLDYGPTAYDSAWSFEFPSNAFLSSVESWHHNTFEDRQFTFRLVTACGPVSFLA